ncbi:MAG: hypothetical protein O3C40_31800 [Planctomycetota bacterium]|nr:hypothetical protein [Planctomycetota bacterium]
MERAGDETFKVAKGRPPEPIENWIAGCHVRDMIAELTAWHEDYILDDCGCEDWPNATSEQCAELAAEWKVNLGAWLDRHDLRPKWVVVDDDTDPSSEKGPIQ